MFQQYISSFNGEKKSGPHCTFCTNKVQKIVIKYFVGNCLVLQVSIVEDTSPLMVWLLTATQT